MEFFRQEYWSRLPFPGDLPDPGIKPMSLVSPALQADSLPAKPLGKRKSEWLGTPQLEEACSGSVSYNSLLTESLGGLAFFYLNPVIAGGLHRLILLP